MSVYNIRVKGHLDGGWSEWFDGLQITNLDKGGHAIWGHRGSSGAAQCAEKVRDLGLPLVGVRSAGPD